MIDVKVNTLISYVEMLHDIPDDEGNCFTVAVVANYIAPYVVGMHA